MKKLFLAGAFALLGLSTVNAQEQAIKANPLALLGGSDLVSYERAIGEKSSFVVGAGIGGYKISGFKYSTFGGGLQYRYYFDEAIKGWYGAGVADFTSGKTTIEDSITGSSNDAEAKTTGFGIGAKAGYQWIFNSGFLIDVNIGASYRNFSYKYDNSQEESYFSAVKASGVLPTFGFAIGYAF